jgi:hypothetical protein
VRIKMVKTRRMGHIIMVDFPPQVVLVELVVLGMWMLEV